MQTIISGFTVFIFSFVGWMAALGVLAFAKEWPRFLFVALHYASNVLLFGVLFGVYFRYVHQFSPFVTMVIAMVSLFGFEFVFWRFLYHGPFWFLNFVDWMVPAFIVASTVYFTGIFLGPK